MRFMNYATLATAAAILFACNEDAKTKSDLRSNSTPGYSDEIAYFKAAGVEFNDENADANGLRLDAVSASQMSLNFKSLKIAYCGVNTTDYADPSVKDFSSKYCTFVTATTNVCRSARALSTSAEVVNSYNSLIALNNTLAVAAQARGYKYNNGVWSLTNGAGTSGAVTMSVSSRTVDRITLEEPCEPIVVAGVNIEGPTSIGIAESAANPVVYKVIASRSDGSTLDVSAEAVVNNHSQLPVANVQKGADGKILVKGEAPGTLVLAASYTATSEEGTKLFSTTKQIEVKRSAPASVVNVVATIDRSLGTILYSWSPGVGEAVVAGYRVVTAGTTCMKDATSPAQGFDVQEPRALLTVDKAVTREHSVVICAYSEAKGIRTYGAGVLRTDLFRSNSMVSPFKITTANWESTFLRYTDRSVVLTFPAPLEQVKTFKWQLSYANQACNIASAQTSSLIVPGAEVGPHVFPLQVIAKPVSETTRYSSEITVCIWATSIDGTVNRLSDNKFRGRVTCNQGEIKVCNFFSDGLIDSTSTN